MSIGLLAAFLGGLISLLSPCSALILPSFLATSFQSRKNLLTATLVFSLGVLTIMLPLGLGLMIIIRALTAYRQLLTLIIGLLLIAEGLFQLTGRSLLVPRGGLHFQPSKSQGLSSAFYLGFISGIGAMSCVGPILGAIITLAANSPHLIAALSLILAYTLGLVGPLFILASLYQKHQSSITAFLKGKVIKISHHQIHSLNLAAALLFFLLGYIFIKYQGSLGLMPLFSHSGILNLFFDLQDKLFSL